MKQLILLLISVFLLHAMEHPDKYTHVSGVNGSHFQLTSDGGALLIGKDTHYSESRYLFLGKMDATGELLWNHRYTIDLSNGFVVSEVENEYVISSDSCAGSYYYTFSLRISHDGDSIGSTLDSTEYVEDTLSAVLENGDRIEIEFDTILESDNFYTFLDTIQYRFLEISSLGDTVEQFTFHKMRKNGVSTKIVSVLSAERSFDTLHRYTVRGIGASKSKGPVSYSYFEDNYSSCGEIIIIDTANNTVDEYDSTWNIKDTSEDYFPTTLRLVDTIQLNDSTTIGLWNAFYTRTVSSSTGTQTFRYYYLATGRIDSVEAGAVNTFAKQKNPQHNLITYLPEKGSIYLENCMNASFSIVNLHGQELFSNEDYVNEIRLPNLSKGIYFCIINNRAINQSARFIID